MEDSRTSNLQVNGSIRAFTLLEMLLVVLILGAVATSLMIVVNDSDDERRFDITKEKYEMILQATTGFQTDATSGFIADMGRLPRNLVELLRTDHPDTTDTTLNIEDALDEWKLVGKNDDNSGWVSGLDANEAQKISIRHGWRGPYLLATGGGIDETDDSVDNPAEFRFRDEWGGDFIVDDEADGSPGLSIYSNGKDRTTDTGIQENRYERDYPNDKTVPVGLYTLQTSTSPEITFTYSSGANLRLGVVFPGIDLTQTWDISSSSSQIERGLAPSTLAASATEQVVNLPSSLFDGRLARDFQLVFYEESGQASDTLADRVHYISRFTFSIPLQASPSISTRLDEAIPSP
ncbi:MAG: hypothetical protein MK183_08265 [Verrucomicrobiales bacterium]|nr:hypothetical protein [Verrucomicrobiales bacterium]